MESAQEAIEGPALQFDELVSILVVMESAQEGWRQGCCIPCSRVSILVVMESAQEVAYPVENLFSHVGFNPCCNGKCSGSDQISDPLKSILLVSILVVMESAQEACFRSAFPARTSGFNPCCNGKCSGSIVKIWQSV